MEEYMERNWDFRRKLAGFLAALMFLCAIPVTSFADEVSKGESLEVATESNAVPDADADVGGGSQGAGAGDEAGEGVGAGDAVGVQKGTSSNAAPPDSGTSYGGLVCICTDLCSEDHFNENCLVCNQDYEECQLAKDGLVEDDTTVTMEKVVELFRALPGAEAITEMTTQEEVDILYTQLGAAMAAYDQLSTEDQAKFEAEYMELLAKAMELNDAITGYVPVMLDLIHGDGYAYNQSTKSLTIEKNEGIENWKKDHEDLKQGIEHVTIGEAVSLIGLSAFEDCKELLDIAWNGNGVEKIGSYAFKGCEKLTAVSLPDSISVIGQDAFENCSLLESVKLPDKLTAVSSRLFINCTSLKSITVPDNVVTIGDDAFSYCIKLERVILPETITSIGIEAFEDCWELTELTLPASLEKMCYQMILRCPSLTKLTFLGATPPEMIQNVFVGYADQGTIVVPVEAGYREALKEHGFGDAIDSAASGKKWGIHVKSANELSSISNGSLFYIRYDAEKHASYMEPDGIYNDTADDWSLHVPLGNGTYIQKIPSRDTLTKSSMDQPLLYGLYQANPLDMDAKVVSFRYFGIPVGNIEIISKGNDTALAVGGTLQLEVNVIPDNAQIKRVTWSVDDSSKAVVSEEGLVTAKAAGLVTVTAMSNDGTRVTGRKALMIQERKGPDPKPTPSGGGGGSSDPVVNKKQQAKWNYSISTNRWTYLKEDGSLAADEWLEITTDGVKERFHFAPDGLMQTGWLQQTDGSWYYLNETSDGRLGAMQTGWVKDPQDGNTYYLDPSTGRMVIGHVLIDGVWYDFKADGTEDSGWQYDEQQQHWRYDPKGKTPYGALIEQLEEA